MHSERTIPQVKATEKSYRDYLNLYIRYRLKVQAAFDMKLDTLAGQITELQNFKSQIVDQYTNDETSLNQMAKEAFIRSQHDLRFPTYLLQHPKMLLLRILPEHGKKSRMLTRT